MSRSRPVSRLMPAGDASIPPQDVDNRDAKAYVAEGRAFLTWIRTGIAPTFSVVLGTALIVCGVLVTILASLRYMRHIRDLKQGVQTADTPSEFAQFVARALS